jgi:tRNA(His) guanylyltransferase
MAKNKSYFGNEIKNYEKFGELILPKDKSIIIRLDGNSFSKLTKNKNFKKPFDDDFRKGMESSLIKTFEYTGAKIGYSQSDEITLLLSNNGFLGNRVSKLCSLVASIASNAFNEYFLKDGEFLNAIFDCRAFIVPYEEVNNVFLWRQQDALKNAVYSVAFFGLQEKGYSARKASAYLKGKSMKEKNELIFKELNYNVNCTPS